MSPRAPLPPLYLANDTERAQYAAWCERFAAVADKANRKTLAVRVRECGRLAISPFYG